MPDVLASTEARDRFPSLIQEVLEHPGAVVEVGRQRRREVVIVNANRYDELIQRENSVRDLAWAVFAHERIANPTSERIGWEEAQRLRGRG